MKKTLLAAVLASALFASCEKKENVYPPVTEKPAPEDSTYIINGITDWTISRIDSTMVTLNVAFQQGMQKKVTLSVEGLPNRVKASFTPATGFPGFGTTMTLTSVFSKPGIYPITVKGTSENGLVKSYKVNLTVKDDVVCDSFILKNTNSLITKYNNLDTAYSMTTIKANGQGSFSFEKLFLDTMMAVDITTGIHSDDKVSFTVNCGEEAFNIAEQTITTYTAIGPVKYTISGSGRLDFENRVLVINYKASSELGKTYFYTMTSKMKLW